jgi:hypothetical protein
LDVWREFSNDVLWNSLETGCTFRRGLPETQELQVPNIAQVFRAVLCNHAVEEETFEDPNHRKALKDCWKNGWLHATMYQKKTMYIFTTPLHRWFVEYYLGVEAALNTTYTGGKTLFEFATNVIRKFSSLQLSSPRRIGASNMQRPPEAQFQDEFYRCCHEHTKGSITTFPEFGDAKGRIDFYFPLDKWGVELLRDGDRLENHSSRFMGQGAYVKMNLQDFIILDFRTTRPRKGHPGQ